MSNNSNPNPNRTSLAGRVAAEKRQAAETRQLKTRVASAYTLAKTMLPTGGAEQHVKVAKSLLALSTPVLGAMLRTAAVNAHFTRVAEEFKNVHKIDLNSLLDDGESISKLKGEVVSELKGDAKNASTKQADDRKECGEQPATYEEGKRTEPSGMDADKVHEPEQKVWTEGGEGKVAKTKKACGDDCKGCDGCGKKEAAAKTAEEGEGEGDAAPAPAPAEGGEGASEEGAPAEGDASAELEDKENEHVEGADADAGEGTGDAEAGDSEGGEEAEGEVFDEEKATLQDAIEDVKDDIDTLTDAIEQELGDAGEINLAEEAQGDGAFDEALADGAMDGGLSDEGAVDGGMDGAPAPEELNIENIFSDDNFADKVSALNDEGEDAFFAPTDAAELEGVLDQEDAIGSPADMFIVEEAEDDPLARIFASDKQAASNDGVLKPGELVKHFDTEHSTDQRDADGDHDGDIFAEVLKSLKVEDDGQKRDKQDATNELKEPKQAGTKVKRAPAKQASKPGSEFPKLATHFDPLAQAAKIAGGNLASLVFNDESDYMD